MKFIDKILKLTKYKYSPFIPDVKFNDMNSRRKWILHMAKKTDRLPVREVYDKMLGHVTKMTINTDLQYLESQKLIRREKEKGQHSFIIPIFEDPEIKILPQEARRMFILNICLPATSGVLLVILITVLIIS